MNNRFFQIVFLSAMLVALGGAGPLGSQTELSRSADEISAPVDGARLILRSVDAHSSWYRSVDLGGGEMTTITLLGDGDTDLDLFVYDADGDLIIKSDGRTDGESVWIIPAATGRFYIRVQNLGSVYNNFSLWIR